jgi:hypothetical protein
MYSLFKYDRNEKHNLSKFIYIYVINYKYTLIIEVIIGINLAMICGYVELFKIEIKSQHIFHN